MKKTNKLWLALLLAVLVAALLAVGFTAAAEEPEIVDSGTCWTLNSNGLLTLNGTEGLYGNPFEGRTDVKNVVLSDGVEIIDAGMFAGCSNLKSIAIPTSVDIIEISAFDSCSALSYVFYSGTPEQWDQIWIYGYLEDMDDAHAAYAQSVREHLKSIARFNTVDWGYCGANDTSAVNYSLNAYDTNAYWTLDKTGLLTIGGTGEVYGRVSAMGDTPWHLYNYGDYGVADGQIRSVKIEPGITNVPDAMCLCNNGLTHVEIPDTVTRIGEWAFYSCDNLRFIDIPDSVTEIGSSVFQCSGLRYVKLPAHLTRISQSTFLKCEDLKSVTIPKDVTRIDSNAFDDAARLSDVYFIGSEEEWNAISISGNNAPLLAATIHFNSEGPAIDPTEWEDDPDAYHWQPIPTSPEGLAEGEWYLDFSRYMSSLVQWSIGVPVAKDLWFFDEEAMALKSEPAPGNPSNTITMGPTEYPVCMQYYAYRFLKRVGETWFVLSSLDPGYNIAGNRVDYPALAQKVIADSDTLTDADYDAVLAAVRDGEWMVDLQHGLMKGCWLLPADLAQSDFGVYQFVYPSAAYFETCVTTAEPPVPEAPDLTSCSGQWSDNISWSLENGTLTVSGTGKLESKTAPAGRPVPRSSRMDYFFGSPNPTISFRSSSPRGTIREGILEDEIYAAFYAHFGVADEDALEVAIAHGDVDPGEASAYFLELITETVQTVVVEEGITEIDSGALDPLNPKKIILPASLEYIYLSGGWMDKMDVYVLNRDADFSWINLQVPVYTEAQAACLRDFDFMPLYRAYYAFEYEIMPPVTLYVDVLQQIALARANQNGSFYYPDLEEAVILANWNYRMGTDYATTDALIAAAIAGINESLGTDFTAFEDIVTIPSAGSSYAPLTEAFEAARDARFGTPLESIAAAYPEYAPLLELFAEESVWYDLRLGEPLPTAEDGTALFADPNLTIHGYLGSTAETAAAASGVTFVPVCPNDYTHTVTEKEETAPTSTNVGHTAGWYCEDCGTYLSGGEVIPPTADDWGYCGGEGDGKNLVWTLNSKGTLTIGGTGDMIPYNGGESPWYIYKDQIKVVVAEEGVTDFGYNAFYNCDKLESVVIPVSVTGITDLAFYKCGAIKNVFYAGDAAQWNRIHFYEIGGPGETGNDDLLNAHRHYNATWHTPGAAVIENEVASTCKTAGGYDEVVYCTQCPYEISRNHVTLALDPDNHEQVAYCEEVLPRPNHVEHGHEAGERCLACGEWLTGEEIHNTDGEWIPLAEATAEDLAGLVVREEDGDYIIICTKCGGRGLYKVENPPEDPTDPTQPTQPDQPDQPDQPGDNGGGENILTSITNGIRKAWNGFIEVFLRLIRWLGGGKK